MNKKECPHCGKQVDPRGYSGHVDNCPEKPDEEPRETSDEDATPTPEEVQQVESGPTEEYEEVSAGANVETKEPTEAVCEECGAYLIDAQKYSEKLRKVANQGKFNGEKLTAESVKYLKHRSEQVENYYAVCPNCSLAYEKTEL